VTRIRAVAFDVNGTLCDIRTEDDAEAVFRAAAHTLTYAGIDLRRKALHTLYTRLVTEQLRAGPEKYPEFDVVAVWQSIIALHATAFTRSLPAARLEQLPRALAELTRGVARRRLRLYPHVREVLDELRTRFPLAVVSDGQSAWARAELHSVGLLEYFDPIVVSGDHGYRKPDARLFRLALHELGVHPAQCLYVGNDMYRDIWGAQHLGMPTVMFDSDQGVKEWAGCKPDHTITDHRELLRIIPSG
jgi:putative hydrolase of the HAD superfamily